MEKREFIRALEEMNIHLSDTQINQLDQYADLLYEWNQKMNLTAIDQKEEVYEKHFLDSIVPLSLYEIQGSVADVGTGAGFPGLVWAIVRSDLRVTLIEPTGKRCNFLNAVTQALQLNNVKVVNKRSEECVELRESFDVVTARAVANLQILSELCVPLVKVGGCFLSMKGAQGDEEASNAEHALQVLGCAKAELKETHLPSGDTRIFVYAAKKKATDAQYPRAYARIKKKPL